jgi:foldase protein PrsA
MNDMAAKESGKKKTVKKSKSVSAKKSAVKKVSTLSSSSLSSKKKGQSVMRSKKYIALVVIIIIAGFAYLFRGLFLAAMVNGTPISRLSVLKELEMQSGQQVLDQLVTESLVVQEAEKQGVSIAQSDIDSEVDKIKTGLEGQGQNLDDVLALQGLTMQQLRERLDTQLKLEKLMEDKVSVDQSEIDDFLEQSKDSLPEDMSAEELQSLAKDQLTQTKMQTEIQKYLQELRDSANIQYFGAYQPSN